MLSLTATALAAPEYTLPYSGVLFKAFFLPDEDLLIHGSFGREAPDGTYADTFARIKPDGTEVWVLDLPVPDDGAPVSNHLLSLSDGRYLISHAKGQDDPHMLVIDAEGDIIGEAPLPFGNQPYFFMSHHIVTVDRNTYPDGIRLTWFDQGYQEGKQKDYQMDHASDLDVMLLETEDSLYLLAQLYRGPKGAKNTLLKLTKDGLLVWKKTYDAPYPCIYIFVPDNDGGVLMLGDNGMYDEKAAYPYTARRVDRDGHTVWEKEIGVGEWVVRADTIMTDQGMRMIWETEDAFQLVTIDKNGEVGKAPVLEKPNIGSPDTDCWISGQAVDKENRVWVYYNMITEVDIYHTDVKPFIQPLDLFPIRKSE